MLMGLISRYVAWGLVSAGLLLGTAGALSAQAPTAINLGTLPLLPPANATLGEGPGGPARPEQDAILKEDALKRQESRGVAPGAWANAYEFNDATGAYAAYTYFAQGGRPTAGVNKSQVRLPSGEQVFQAGTSVVRASAQVPAEILKRIDVGLPKIGGRRGLAPLLPTLLPAEHLQKDSIRYALGPAAYQAMGGVLPDASLLGWEKSAEVATASYGNGKEQLTLLLYPTPQIAGDRGRAVENSLNQAGITRFGTVKMRRLGPLVGVTTGAWTPAEASAMLGSLTLNQEVTFSRKIQPEFHAEVRKTYTLLQSIAAFTGLAILASVVLAIFLGGARAGIRVLQGKPAASEPEFLRLDLRDKPKISPTDKP